MKSAWISLLFMRRYYILLLWEKNRFYTICIIFREIRILRSVILILSVENSRRAKWVLSRSLCWRNYLYWNTPVFKFPKGCGRAWTQKLTIFCPIIFYTFFLLSTSQQNAIIKNNIKCGCHVNGDYHVSLWRLCHCHSLGRDSERFNFLTIQLCL